MSIGRADLPLGTTEAAVRSCVSVIAAVTAQREEVLAYWLDLYYQVRRAYEIEQGHEEDPRLIRLEDLSPAMREMMRDALKSTAREEAKKRTKAKDDGGPPRASAPTGKAEDGEPLSPAEAGQLPLQGSQGGARVGGWAAKKAEIRDRLLKARAEGVTIAEITNAGGKGVCFEGEVLGILNAAKVDMPSYRRVEAALDALGR